MKRINLLLILFMLACSTVLAQDETGFRTIDTTLVFSESDFKVGTHPRTGNQSIGRANQEDTEWNRPKEEMASVPWRVVKIFVARDESLVDINCEAEDETLYIENLNLRQQNGESLNEDFPKNRVYVQGFTSAVNAEHTGFLYFYQFLVSPFRYDSQNNNFYLYKKVRLKVRFMKNPPTIVKVYGTVKNQDGQPLPEASLTFAGTEYDIGEDGTYQMLLNVPTYTDGWREAVSGNLEVKAEGYTSFSRQTSFEQQWTDSDWYIDFILYNQLHFLAGKRYTLILPKEPNASLGRYFRLDRVEGSKIIFEREPSPNANIPYVFFPDNDVTISLKGMDLTQKAGCTIVNDNREDYSSGKDPRVFFEGFYVTGEYSKYWFASNYVRIEEEEYYQSRSSYYGSDAMHAILYFQWNLFSTTPELLFHDPSVDAIHNAPASINHQSSNHQWFDLSGRRVSASPASSVLPRGVYIHDGKKVVVR